MVNLLTTPLTVIAIAARTGDVPGFSQQANRAYKIGHGDIERRHPAQLLDEVRGSQVKAAVGPDQRPFESSGGEPLGNEQGFAARRSRFESRQFSRIRGMELGKTRVNFRAGKRDKSIEQGNMRIELDGKVDRALDRGGGFPGQAKEK